MAAIAISRGGAKKTYAYRDPNEDAAGFAWSDAGTLLVVADGHAGCDAAQIAIEHVIDDLAPRLLDPQSTQPGPDWPDFARDAALGVHDTILQRARITASHPPRTTLAIALARRDHGSLAWLSVGDSLIFRVDAQQVTRLRGEPRRVAYLGSPRDDRERLVPGIDAGTAPLAGTRAIALATDGLSEEGIGVSVPANAVQQAVVDATHARTPELRPLDAARSLAEIANQSHRDQQSGDNIATAVAWLGE